MARTLAAAALMAWGSALAAPFAYVPNEGSGTLSVIDTATNTVVNAIDVGERPWGVLVLPQ